MEVLEWQGLQRVFLKFQVLACTGFREGREKLLASLLPRHRVTVQPHVVYKHRTFAKTCP